MRSTTAFCARRGMAEAEQTIHAALAGRRAWLVGGAVRDRIVGRATQDLDVVVEGDPGEAARAIARAAPGGAACFALSEAFAGWRVIARDGRWQMDVQSLRGGSLAADLALRDFTVNALAQPLDPEAPLEDPLGGLADLAARRLRQASPRAFADDPLRALRLVRLALELDLEPEPETARAAAAVAGRLMEVAGERLFMELRRILASPRAPAGLARMDELGITAAVLPEVHALHGVPQSRYHHRDVHGHTLEALQRVIDLQRFAENAESAEEIEGAEGVEGVEGVEGAEEVESAEEIEGAAAFDLALGARRAAVSALLAEPLADQLTRGEALRWGALLHDAAKPLTAARRPDGRITFMGHDVHGAELARAILMRLRVSERLRAHIAALVRHHLRLGFLVHQTERPLARRVVFDYLTSTTPVEVDVTLLSIADRLATRGDRAAESIDAHLNLARPMLTDALCWRAEGPPTPLWRGDELAAELGIATGPRIGELLHELAAAQYAGEVKTRAEALVHASALLAR